jgi:ABC-type transport system substrate-binding protein
MMNRYAALFLKLFIGAALVTGLGACSKETPKEAHKDAQQVGQLVVGIEAEPERLNPLTMKNPKNFIISWQIFEGLLGLDNAGRISPAIAEKWETKDNITWLFHIRKGVSFHASDLFGSPARSRPVTAHDVVASYTAFCSSAAYPAFLLTDSIKGCADYNAGKAQAVQGVRAVDDNTVEMVLNKPEPFFLNRLTTSWIAIFPGEALDAKYKDSWGLTFAVGTGPFRLVSRNDTEIVLERNPDYWGKTQNTAVNKLVFRVIKNDQVRLAELNKGGIDMMLLPPTLFPEVLESTGALKAGYTAKFHTKTYSTYNSHMIGMNVLKVPDVHLRRAMFYGVDRGQIVQKLLYGEADITGGTVPPGINGYVPPFATDKLYNPELARQELAKSKYKGAPIELLVHEQAASEQIGQLFQDQMKSLGINIQLTKLDFNSVIGRMVKGDAPMFGMYLDYVFSSPEPILINMFSSAKRPVPNFWQFSDPSVDAELESLRVLKGDEAVKKSAQIEKKIMEQAPGIFLFRLKGVVLYSNRYSDLPINPHGYFEFDALK